MLDAALWLRGYAARVLNLIPDVARRLMADEGLGRGRSYFVWIRLIGWLFFASEWDRFTPTSETRRWRLTLGSSVAIVWRSCAVFAPRMIRRCGAAGPRPSMKRSEGRSID